MLKEARNDKKEFLISLGWCFFWVDDAKIIKKLNFNFFIIFPFSPLKICHRGQLTHICGQSELL